MNKSNKLYELEHNDKIFKIYETFTISDCIHEFEFLDEISQPTCLRTHEISKCLKCDIDYYNRSNFKIYDKLEELKKNIGDDIYYCTPINHFHIWRSDGTCGSKLNFPYNGDKNIGFDKKSYGYLDNKLRNCYCKRT